MKDEIKQMIDNLKFISEQESATIEINQNGCKVILDYITNLQEELEEEKRIEQADFKTIQNLEEENERLNNITNECMESICCIEHNLEKYEEIGLDHFDYALNKTTELKEYLYEELKELKEGNK